MTIPKLCFYHSSSKNMPRLCFPTSSVVTADNVQLYQMPCTLAITQERNLSFDANPALSDPQIQRKSMGMKTAHGQQQIRHLCQSLRASNHFDPGTLLKPHRLASRPCLILSFRLRLCLAMLLHGSLTASPNSRSWSSQLFLMN